MKVTGGLVQVLTWAMYMDKKSNLFRMSLFELFAEETLCEQRENMQTPHRKAWERAHLNTKLKLQAGIKPSTLLL